MQTKGADFGKNQKITISIILESYTIVVFII